MKDKYWSDAWRTASTLLKPNDVVMAPLGDWPAFPCRVSFYAGPFALQDATVLFLHKGKMAALDKVELAETVHNWHCVYSNDVFVVLSATVRASFGPSRWLYQFHARPLSRYLRSRQLKKRSGTIWFVHIPKTGGTSLWTRLRQEFLSNVYYSDIESFLANPPLAGEYDLVGIHFSVSAVLPLLCDEDWLVGMVRSPTERFFSSVKHARRPQEDTLTFNTAMRAMREVEVADHLRTEAGRIEARMQLLILGGDHQRTLKSQADGEMLRNAVALLDRPNTLFAPSSRSGDFNCMLSDLFGLRLRRLGKLNADTVLASYEEEFSRVRQMLEWENRSEQRLYKTVETLFATNYYMREHR
jgi:hypothetical protein